MSIELTFVTGIAAAIGGLIALVRPIVSSYLHRGVEKNITLSIKAANGEVLSVALHGETGQQAIEKILRDLDILAEGKNGGQVSKPK